MYIGFLEGSLFANTYPPQTLAVLFDFSDLNKPRLTYIRQYPLGFALRYLRIFEELSNNREVRRFECPVFRLHPHKKPRLSRLYRSPSGSI